MDNAIEVSSLTKYYGTLLAVDNVSFKVKKGEIFGFLGPNGAGKTTTLRMLTGVIKPTSGSARIMGYDIQSEPNSAKKLMGIVPEMSNPYVDLSAWQNLMLMGELYGVSKQKRVENGERLLKTFELFGQKDQAVKTFSKGMKQRLSLAMALIHEPQILFLDEPTSGLDVKSTRLIKELVKKLNVEGITVFLTTHNMDEASSLCDRVAIIDHGKIAAIDSPEKLKRTIKNLQIVEASFSQSVDMELELKFPKVARLEKSGDKYRFHTDDPNQVIFDLVKYAVSHKLSFVSLNTLSPTLEDVFVELTEKQ